MYIYERNDWPQFKWNQQTATNLLIEVRHLQGRLLGKMETLGFRLQNDATLQALTQDILKSNEIEGEKLDTEQVRSSVAKRLGMDMGATITTNRHIDGIVKMMLDATQHFEKPLTKERLLEWHAALFPEGKNNLQRITTGKWRTKESGPMQVISGPIGREKIHFEAPGYHALNKEMSVFIKWFNAAPETDFIIKAALAHFWFVTIHPFEDGNGRIARAIADMLLARSENNIQRFYSMSAQIQKERNTYYDILESCQKGSLDITPWIHWFLDCLKRAILASDDMLKTILTKAHFWAAHTGESFNERQRLILNRLLDGFHGNLTSSKWAKITKCSQDTALRDISALIERKILIKNNAGGRSTCYQLALLSQ